MLSILGIDGSMRSDGFIEDFVVEFQPSEKQERSQHLIENIQHGKASQGTALILVCKVHIQLRSLCFSLRKLNFLLDYKSFKFRILFSVYLSP